MTSTTAPDHRRVDVRRDLFAAAGLALLTFAVFCPALHFEFVNLDDPSYVTRNEDVRAGLSARSVWQDFTTFNEANWHPLTWLSLQLDASLWRRPGGDLDPLGFHLTNLLLHSANAAILFLALRALTGCFRPSLFSALLFAIHPLRVESVAWVAERKDVLCTLFGLLALRAYARYANAPSAVRYVPILILFALSLSAKSMFVTLPCLFLVLDNWPLRRWHRYGIRFLVAEKIPLFCMSALVSAVTVFAQSGHGAVVAAAVIPLPVRIENALLSYGAYLWKTVWPLNLAVFYPHYGLSDRGLDSSAVLLAATVVCAISVAAVVFRNRAPYLLTGWLWYLGMLVPVIGIVQVGGQAYADRYTYIPQVGIWIAICWAMAENLRSRPRLVMSLGFAVAIIFAALSWRQLAFWHDSRSLWEHDLACAGECPFALNNYGVAILEQGDVTRAIAIFQAAVDGDPNNREARLNLGSALQKQGRLAEATKHFEALCTIVPDSSDERIRLGDILFDQRRFAEAAQRYREALKLTADSIPALCGLGKAELALNRVDNAETVFRTALRIRPASPAAHNGLGSVYLARKQLKAAMEEFAEAARIDPEASASQMNLGAALEQSGDLAAAAKHFESATRLSPDLALAWFHLGRIRAQQGRMAEAAEAVEKAAVLEPGSTDLTIALAAALDGLAASQAKAGHYAEAAASARRARVAAARVNRADLVEQIEGRLRRYEQAANESPRP